MHGECAAVDDEDHQDRGQYAPDNQQQLHHTHSPPRFVLPRTREPGYTDLRNAISTEDYHPSRDAVWGPICCGDYSSAACTWKSKSRVPAAYFSVLPGNDFGRSGLVEVSFPGHVRLLRPEKLLLHQIDSSPVQAPKG